MKILDSKISRKELADNFLNYFKSMVKAVVDIRRGAMAIDGELHADLEGLLLADGSNQDDLWGLNLFPKKSLSDFIEYEALINIRPHQDNPSMKIASEEIRQAAKKVVDQWVIYAA